jgi:hypothetical protein
MVEKVEDIFCGLGFFWWRCVLICKRRVARKIVVPWRLLILRDR